jgi:2-oxoisovalerate ferredoxin oxidoreductase alpha subunit
MAKQLIKGNEAIVKGAILSGCRAFYGYPITPASEIAEAAAFYMPQVGGVFLQAESEVAAINMVYGAASVGVRAMTASSGPGLSLMQEGVSYMAGAELPCVVADIMRGGPGLGNIAPEQGDYHQIVGGGGHGNYHTFVMAPSTVQEMADLTSWAFEIADEYRNPAVVLADGYIGQMMEPVEFGNHIARPPKKSWAVEGTAETRANLVTSIYMSPDELEAHVKRLEAKYRHAEQHIARAELWQTDDAEIILVGYGIVARILKAVVQLARAQGLPVGLLRPITLYPFPVAPLLQLSRQAHAFFVVELSTGQLLNDVRLVLQGRTPVEFYGRYGGNVPSAEEVLGFVREKAEPYLGVTAQEGKVALG